MDKKEVLRRANDPKYISGIYNYCDRWCERCAFTSRCLTYEMDKEDAGDSAARDLNNKAFWDKLHSIFQQTIEMINELAKERGIDLNSIDIESASNEISKRLEESEDHELSLSARYYSEMVDNWFESEYSLFEQKQDELNTMLNLGISVEKNYTEADEISDAIEVIRWYQNQIYVKLMRALTHEEFPDASEEDDTLQKGSNGSALVALIGIDRSIGAWGKLQEYFTAKTDSLLDILVHLNRLRQMTEKAFPDARNFKRPGFDDMD
ncbi:MAG: hypothetical protein HZA06_01190 [Nitrospirae bacterium]|nr:hypothetical protein [Candidatus Omnitrophota bacterium]MBI5181508.1 hypothetical protein [Nitrospirota bacterium]